VLGDLAGRIAFQKFIRSGPSCSCAPGATAAAEHVGRDAAVGVADHHRVADLQVEER
jgi:hypothetical protein